MESPEAAENHHASIPAKQATDGPSISDARAVVADAKVKRLMEHDSLVTVRLSEPPSLDANTDAPETPLPTGERSLVGQGTPSDSTEISEDGGGGSCSADVEIEARSSRSEPSAQDKLGEEDDREASGKVGREEEGSQTETETRTSVESDKVNWDDLQKTEDEECKEQESDKSTAMLLARLEQENAKLATNPKTMRASEGPQQADMQKPTPPSMAQLRQMVNGPTPPALRYSMLPPPPMTDLEFYMALVKDPQQTAARLPTLLANKIRKGIPPPLRGVVWQSMSGARDSALEDMYERLCGESSPYEGIIGKDLGRSFPGVDMFRDPDGDGQRMLGRVLKCFSLYDTKIGYCQGLAFLVGPLLMHMTDKTAFCVLVRLMENYDLRHCFVPDLSGLHVRIYQFRELLRQHVPALSAHLEEHQVDPAYVSQWFLSFFAVTCPLPMLFRIYDVVFAEGASETIMRVALSLMRKNQARILACSEFEDVMQLLLSRSLWDCYHYKADEFVQDFVSFSDAVTREKLAVLEQAHREAKLANNTNPRADGARASEVSTAASRFLGRLWASSNPRVSSLAHPTLSTLSPGASASTSASASASSRPISMLRRSTSKQSLASTINEAASATLSSAASVLSAASTEGTSVTSTSRDSSNTDDSSFGGQNAKATGAPARYATGNKEDRHLHGQIEDLLTALSELQRNHALLAGQLQREREERDEDNKAVRSLLDGLRQKTSTETVTPSAASAASDPSDMEAAQQGSATPLPTAEQLSDLLDVVEARFVESKAIRASEGPETKEQLREELARAKEQLSNEMAKTRDRDRSIYDMEQEVTTIKDQLRDSHAHVRNLHQEKQRLEKKMHDMRASVSDASPSATEGGDWFSRITPTSVPAPAGGLRQLKLGRTQSSPANGPLAPPSKRSSSMMTIPRARESVVGPPASPPTPPASELEALMMQLAQAKTAEAIARQEADEYKQKLESLRRSHGVGNSNTAPAANSNAAADLSTAASSAASAAMGVFGRLTGSANTPSTAAEKSPTRPLTSAQTAPANGGGFWGWRR